TGNEIRMGKEVDEWGAPVAFHFWDRPYTITSTPRGRFRVPSSDVLHLYIQDRPNQTRGITWAHAAMVPLQMLGAYIIAEVIAARLGAAKVGFYVNKGEGAPYGSGDPKTATSTRAFVEDLAPGTAKQLPTGWEFQGWNPDHPNSAFPEFVKAMGRAI